MPEQDRDGADQAPGDARPDVVDREDAPETPRGPHVGDRQPQRDQPVAQQRHRQAVSDQGADDPERDRRLRRRHVHHRQAPQHQWRVAVRRHLDRDPALQLDGDARVVKR
jgi:hypothetical protein